MQTFRDVLDREELHLAELMSGFYQVRLDPVRDEDQAQDLEEPEHEVD